MRPTFGFPSRLLDHGSGVLSLGARLGRGLDVEPLTEKRSPLLRAAASEGGKWMKSICNIRTIVHIRVHPDGV